MKKLIVFALSLALLLAGCAPAAGAAKTAAPAAAAAATHGNYSDEMKIPHAFDLDPEAGADSAERAGDHADSPYFSRLDFYNMTSTETLTILPRFQTQQQSSEWNCGVSAAEMVVNWYGRLGTGNEETLAELRSNCLTAEATSLRQLKDIFDGLGGWDVYSTFDCADDPHSVFTFDFIRENLAAGRPIIVGWNDWGGHWQVIIGYDTMGTETTQDDVIIVADSYDTTDHNQDGYGVYGAERFLYNFTFYDFFPEEELNDCCFLVAAPQK